MNEAAVIVGGGIAGAAAAAALARAGRPPLLLERSSGPHHKVCGEFLSWEAADRLAGVGFDVAALGGVPIAEVRIFGDGRSVRSRLPRAATGISRFRLDEALLQHAARCGARVERGVNVRSAAVAGRGFVVDAGGAVEAASLFLATGKSNLRGLPRAFDANAVTGDLVGFKLHYRLTTGQAALLAGAVELHLFGDGGYAGLQPVEDGIANLCLLVRKASLGGGSWDALLAAILADAPVLAARLGGAEMRFEKPLTIAGVPYGFIHAAERDPPGLFRLGDQFAVVHSFTGDGMAIAATSGTVASGAGGGYAAELRRRVGRPVRASALLSAGLRAPRIRGGALVAARAWPGLIGLAARLTRVAD